VRPRSTLDIQVSLKLFIGGMGALTIGQVAQLAGVTTPTIRYYESIGLLRKPARTTAGYRQYSHRTVKELDFIGKARALGFTLEEIGEIVQLTRAGKRPCARVMDLTRQRLREVDEQMQRLAAFRSQLNAELHRWERDPDAPCNGSCQMIDSSTAAAGSELPSLRTNSHSRLCR
jgi:MerR family transcriptional regulator, copper efflux regulator